MLAVKVFSTTKRREELGDAMTSWIAARADLQIDRIEVRQSSDGSHHCLSIVVFYRVAPTADS
jgi:hypothetical protein